MYWSPQLLGRSFQKARNFTASSHQNAGFSIWVFKNFLGVTHPDPHIGRGGNPLPTPIAAFGQARGASARCWDPNLGPPQLLSCGCAPHVMVLSLSLGEVQVVSKSAFGYSWIFEYLFTFSAVSQENERLQQQSLLFAHGWLLTKCKQLHILMHTVHIHGAINYLSLSSAL